MSVEADIAAMKAELGVASDGALMARLKMSRNNVDRWRQIGRVSCVARNRARLIAEHVPHNGDNLERVVADIGALHRRLSLGTGSTARVQAGLLAIVDRVQALERLQ